MKACPDCSPASRAGCCTCAGAGELDDAELDAIEYFEQRIRDAKPDPQSVAAAVAAARGEAICGCTDSRACEGGCSWVMVDRTRGLGICSSCTASPSALAPTAASSSFHVVAREQRSLVYCRAAEQRRIDGPRDEGASA